MGWWKRMRNKLHRKKTTRPLRYGGHGAPGAGDVNFNTNLYSSYDSYSGSSNSNNSHSDSHSSNPFDDPSGGTTTTRDGGWLRARTTARGRERVPQGDYYAQGQQPPQRRWWTSPRRTPPEKALIEDERYSMSGVRPSMGSSMMEPMSFELPRR